VPTGVRNVFHTSLLRSASNDPFPIQRNDDYQPPAEIIESEPEYQVERILDERRKRVGRGYRHEYLVKWVCTDERSVSGVLHGFLAPYYIQ